jgi:dihydropteroate synthase
VEARYAFRLRFPDGGALELGERTAVMGILNVTPDSFSDGGRYVDPNAAVDRASRMLEEGADLIDVGGESTRPGADPVDAETEMARVLPVVRALKRSLGARVSVDTAKASVARAALDAGADVINDVSGLADPDMASAVRDGAAAVVIMHMRGTPRTMQHDTRYDDFVGEVVAFLAERVRKAAEAGVSDDSMLVDPGLGFGKSVAGNLTILKKLPALRSLGKPILIGASRKSFLGAASGLPVEQRLEAGLAVAAYAAAQGAHLLRVHDVRATVRAAGIIDAVRRARETDS